MTDALSDLVFTPLVDPLWLLAIAAVTLLLSLYAGWRRTPGALLRPLAMAAVLLALANPQLVSETRRPIADVAVIVPDRLRSQPRHTRSSRGGHRRLFRRRRRRCRRRRRRLCVPVSW